MSHIVGTIQPIGPVVIGPDSGAASTSPNTWLYQFTAAAPPTGVAKYALLHFRDVSLPASNRLEVDLGYDTDVFTSADGTDFWTRPVNLTAFAGGQAPVRYITNGAANGGATLDKYGRGERHSGDQDPSALSNCDPFLLDATYVEPIYDPFWFCHTPPNWENSTCVVPAGDIRLSVGSRVGMFVQASKSEHVSPQIDILSTCTVTLVGPDMVLTAGHCMGDLNAPAPDEEGIKSCSVIFDYATECDGSRPAGYTPRFYKVIRSLGFRWDGDVDYCLMQIDVPPGGLGLTPIEMRPDLPAVGEQIFGLHHPNGAVRKLSIPHPGFQTVNTSSSGAINVDLDVSGGSSGSGLFDVAGRVTGVLSDGFACSLNYFPTQSILQQISAPPPPVVAEDVMLIIDRSGSMSMDSGSGRTKIEEARDAASLFVQLVRSGGGNRMGLVSFSTIASTDLALADVTAVNKNTLVGPAPFTSGIVGGLTPGGVTSIGAGLDAARLQFPGPGANPRAVLLMTDGLQNTPPMIADIGGLGGITINAIGFGFEGGLDGALLTDLSETHGGLYMRAGDGLALKKYFALAFGNIFEAGALLDPEFTLKESQSGSPIPFQVCGEETITIVIGWDNVEASLFARVTTPGGAVIDPGTPGVESETGRTWTYLRIPLPHAGERDGQWTVTAMRVGGGGEFPPPQPHTRGFVNVVASGGPVLKRIDGKVRYYTGDKFNPLVQFAYPTGGVPENAKLRLTILRPDTAAGDILSRSGLDAPMAIGGDTIPARQATMIRLQTSGGATIGHTELDFDLVSDWKSTGRFAPAGFFGKPMDDLLTVEGNYTFHVVATYGEGCVSSREIQWTVQAEPAVDPGRTIVTVGQAQPGPGGTMTGTVVITPKDPSGHNLGPGRAPGMTISAGPGTTVTGPPQDNGDGTYTVPVTWDPAGGGPSVVVGQPGRPPVVVGPQAPPPPPAQRCKFCWLLVLLLLILLILVLLARWT